MKLHVKFDISGLSVDEMIEGETSADIARTAKRVIASRLDFLSGAFVKSMSDLGFAQEVVRRYNSATGSSCSLPKSTDAFVEWVIERGLASVVE